MIACYHDMTVTLMYNEIQLQRGEKIHTGFPVTPNQWKRERLNSEKCLDNPGYSRRRTWEMCRTNRDQWLLSYIEVAFEFIMLLFQAHFIDFGYTVLGFCTCRCLIF